MYLSLFLFFSFAIVFACFSHLLGAVIFPVCEACRHRAVDFVPALDENHVHDGGPQARGDVAAIVPVGIKRLRFSKGTIACTRCYA